MRRLGCQDPIWIDAICINQEDLDEKGVQVETMSEIYKFASRTIICLGIPMAHIDAIEQLAIALEMPRYKEYGEGEYDFEIAQGKALALSQVLDEIQGIITSERVSYKDIVQARSAEIYNIEQSAIDYKASAEAKCDLFWEDDSPSRLSERAVVERVLMVKVNAFTVEHTSVMRLFAIVASLFDDALKAPYWRRVWILQELCTSTNAQFLTTEGELTLATFLTLYDVMQKLRVMDRIVNADRQSDLVMTLPAHFRYVFKNFSTFDVSTDTGKFREVRRLVLFYGGRGILTVDAVESTIDRGCSDSRDRVYAIRALLVTEEKIDVNYDRTVEQIFWETIQTNIVLGKLEDLDRLAIALFRTLEIRPPQTDPLIDTETMLRDWPCNDPKSCYGWAVLPKNVESIVPDIKPDLGLYLRLADKRSRFTDPSSRFEISSSSKYILIEFLVVRRSRQMIRAKSPRSWVPFNETWIEWREFETVNRRILQSRT